MQAHNYGLAKCQSNLHDKIDNFVITNDRKAIISISMTNAIIKAESWVEKMLVLDGSFINVTLT